MAAGVEPLADSFEGFAWLTFARAHQQGVVKILPQFSVLNQINDYRGFLATVIHDVTDAAHKMTIEQIGKKSSPDFWIRACGDASAFLTIAARC